MKNFLMTNIRGMYSKKKLSLSKFFYHYETKVSEVNISTFESFVTIGSLIVSRLEYHTTGMLTLREEEIFAEFIFAFMLIRYTVVQYFVYFLCVFLCHFCLIFAMGPYYLICENYFCENIFP